MGRLAHRGTVTLEEALAAAVSKQNGLRQAHEFTDATLVFTRLGGVLGWLYFSLCLVGGATISYIGGYPGSPNRFGPVALLRRANDTFLVVNVKVHPYAENAQDVIELTNVREDVVHIEQIKTLGSKFPGGRRRRVGRRKCWTSRQLSYFWDQTVGR